MSTLSSRVLALSKLALSGLILALVLPHSAMAQNVESETDRRVQDMVTGQKRQTDLRDKRCYLPARPGDDIVVWDGPERRARVALLRELLELAVNPEAPRVCASTFPREAAGEGGDPARPPS